MTAVAIDPEPVPLIRDQDGRLMVPDTRISLDVLVAAFNGLVVGIGALILGVPLAGTIASQVKQFPQANYDFLDASSLGLNDAEVAHLYIPQLLEYISSGTGRYNKVLIAVGSLLQHARSIPVARAVDASERSRSLIVSPAT